MHAFGRGLPGWGDLPPSELENVPAFQWPQCIDTYRAMLTDPQVWALVQAVALPVGRYRVELDPNGMDEADAQMLADDLDVPLRGADPDQAAERSPLRFSYRRHVRRALTALNIGHAVFELVGEIRDGRWRLTDLAPRPARTLISWRVDRQGRLVHIEQENFGAGLFHRTILRADHLAVYTWGGEVGDPRGESMLRPLGRPYVAKDRLARLDMIKHERNAMGVPVGWVRDDNSPADKEDMDAILAGIAAGEDSFVSLVAGQDFKLRGVEGATSDVIRSLEFHNAEMARAMHGMVVNITSGGLGSHGLAETQLDLLRMFWDVIVGWACDVTSREVCGAWSRFNLGSDAPVAKLVWRREGEEARTETYAYYLEYQLLTVDEARARIGLPPLPNGEGERLPESFEVLSRIEDRGVTAAAAEFNAARERHGLRPMSEVQFIQASGAGGSAPVAAAGRRARSTPAHPRARRPVAAAATVPVPDRELRRQPTALEAASGVDFAVIDEEWTDTQQTVSELLQGVRADLAAVALDAIRDMDAVEPLLLAETLAPILAEAAGEQDTGPLQEALEEAARRGAEQVAAEIDRAGGTAAPAAVDYEARAQLEAANAVRRVAASLVETATNAAVARAQPGAAGSAVADVVEEAVDRLTTAQPDQAASGMTSRAQNAGRAGTLDASPAREFYGSALLDTNTCGPCSAWDGRTFATLDEAMEQYPGGGGNRDCEGGDQCRCIVVGRLADEQERAT